MTGFAPSSAIQIPLFYKNEILNPIPVSGRLSLKKPKPTKLTCPGYFTHPESFQFKLLSYMSGVSRRVQEMKLFSLLELLEKKVVEQLALSLDAVAPR